MQKSRAARILGSQPKRPTNALRRIVLLERKPHPVLVRASAPKAPIRLIWLKEHGRLSPSTPVCLRGCPASNQGYSCRRAFIPPAALPLPQLRFQQLSERLHSSPYLLLIESRKTQPQCIRLRMLEIKVPSRHKNYSAPAQVDQQFRRVDARRQGHPEGNPALRPRPRRFFGHMLFEAFLHRLEPAQVVLVHLR